MGTKIHCLHRGKVESLVPDMEQTLHAGTYNQLHAGVEHCLLIEQSYAGARSLKRVSHRREGRIGRKTPKQNGARIRHVRTAGPPRRYSSTASAGPSPEISGKLW